MKKQRQLALGLEVLFNFALPYVLYVLADHRLGDVRALLLSSVPPILWSAVELVRKRRLDAISMLVIAGIVLSLLAFLGGGSVRMLQLREQLVTGVIGLIFLGSVVIGRPLLLEVVLATIAQTRPEDVVRLRTSPVFRSGITVMTLIWGFGLIAGTVISSVMVFHMPIKRFLVVGPVVGYAVYGLLSAWTFWYGKGMKRRGEAARAAATAQPGSALP